MIRAFIFDFDGLILDTETVWYEVYQEVLQKDYNVILPIEEFLKCVGADDSSLQTYLREEIDVAVDIQQIKQQTSERHRERIQSVDACLGVRELIEAAHQKGLKIVLATSSNNEWVTTHLRNLNLLHYFDHLVTSDDVEHVKPAPDLYEKALEVLGIHAWEAIVFEDSLNGLLAAKKVGLPTVIVPNPVTESLPFENYDLKLGSLNDMPFERLLDYFQNERVVK